MTGPASIPGSTNGGKGYESIYYAIVEKRKTPVSVLSDNKSTPNWESINALAEAQSVAFGFS